MRPGSSPVMVSIGIERVARVDGLEEARGLIEEGDQRVAHHVREDAGARRALGRHQQAVGEEVAVAARPAVGPVVVDRVVVARGELEGGEERVGHGARGNVEALAHPEVVEVARLGEAVRFGRELLIGHRAAPPSLDLLDLHHQIAIGQLPHRQPHAVAAPEVRAVQHLLRLGVEGHPAHLVHEARGAASWLTSISVSPPRPSKTPVTR